MLDIVLTFMDLINQGVRAVSLAHPARAVEQSFCMDKNCSLGKKRMRKASHRRECSVATRASKHVCRLCVSHCVLKVGSAKRCMGDIAAMSQRTSHGMWKEEL